MTTVPTPVAPGQDPLPTSLPTDPALDLHNRVLEARALLQALRMLAFDAAATRGERQHSRQYLRRTMKTRFRALEARLIAIDPPPAVDTNSAT